MDLLELASSRSGAFRRRLLSELNPIAMRRFKVHSMFEVRQVHLKIKQTLVVPRAGLKF